VAYKLLGNPGVKPPGKGLKEASLNSTENQRVTTRLGVLALSYPGKAWGFTLDYTGFFRPKKQFHWALNILHTRSSLKKAVWINGSLEGK